MKVGEIIAGLRKSHGYTRTDFAEKIGIPQTTLRNYETGVREPGHSFLIQMANEFLVSTDYLLGITDDPTPFAKENAPAISSEALEVASAYDSSDLEHKRIARSVLGMNSLPEKQDEPAKYRDAI